jgi:mono/diheme cytochrome c family protein
MRPLGIALAAIAIVFFSGFFLASTRRSESASPPHVVASSRYEAGRYLVKFGACNDCHTPGWRESDGKLPVSQWLTGSNIGYRAAWGTSYPPNIRLIVAQVSEEQWLAMIRTRADHPPMPWHELRVLSEDDRRAIYQFIRALGPAGKPAPFNLRPDRKPLTPYVDIDVKPGALPTP